jgi:hypothetical protein
LSCYLGLRKISSTVGLPIFSPKVFFVSLPWGSQNTWPVDGSQIRCFLLLGFPIFWLKVGNQFLLLPFPWASHYWETVGIQVLCFLLLGPPISVGPKSELIFSFLLLLPSYVLAHSWQSSLVFPFFLGLPFVWCKRE